MESSYKTYARLALLGLLVSVLPLKFETGLTAGFSFAYAKDGESGGGGRSGRDGGDDGGGDRGGRDGGDDGADRSGRSGGDDDRDGDDRDDDDDNSGSGSSGGDDGSWRSQGSEGGGSRDATRSNIDIRYSNGWHETIRGGRYRLTDPNGRTVADRRARSDDVIRMRQTAGQ